jgi:hypothetical protein
MEVVGTLLLIDSEIEKGTGGSVLHLPHTRLNRYGTSPTFNKIEEETICIMI